MHLYKGVAPGTHYGRRGRDPTRYGFVGSSNQPTDVDAVVLHVTGVSWPSAWVSTTMSFAVAADYATAGGKVYEIILSRIGPEDIVDPVAMLARHSDAREGRFVHGHDGHQNLTPSVALPSEGAKILTTAPLRIGAPPTRRGSPPMVSRLLNALVFATRDAELLLTAVPSRAVGHVYTIPRGHHESSDRFFE